MSDTTLYSSLYEYISEFAEKIDTVLIAYVSNRPDARLFRQLGEILEQLAKPKEGNLAHRMIAQMLMEGDSIGRDELETAAKVLRDGAIDEVTKDVVERLASSLEQERTKVMARIRGELR